MDTRITINRIGDRIALLSQSGAEIATLFDGSDHIIVDNLADTRGLLDGIDWNVVIAKAGLDTVTVRLVDAMPCPMRQEVA